MVDLNSLSDSDLEILANGGDLESLSDDALAAIASGGGAPSAPHSETRAVTNAGLRGLGSFLGFVDELSPITYDPDTVVGLRVPHLFGLGADNGEEDFMSIFDRVGTETGALTQDKPQTETGKLLANMAEQGAATLPFGPMAALTAAAFGGTGAYGGEKIATSLGYDPTLFKAAGSIVGSGVPAAVRGTAKAVGRYLGPLTKSGTDTAIGRLLLDTATDAPAAQTALSKVDDAASVFSPFKTTAEIAGDSGLARLEDGVASMNLGFNPRDIDAARAVARADEVNAMFNPNISRIERSKGLEDAVGVAVSKLDKIEDAAWKALPKGVPVSVSSVVPEIRAVVDEFALSVDDAPASIKGLLKKISKFDDQVVGAMPDGSPMVVKGEATLGEIQKLRSQALKISRSSSDGVERALANQIAAKLEEAVELSDEGNEAIDIWKAARQVTRGNREAMGATPMLKKATGLSKGDIFDAQLLNEGLNSPDKFSALLGLTNRAGVNISDDVKGALLQSVTQDSAGLPLSQARWASEFAKRRPQFEAVFSPDEIAKIQGVLDDVGAQANKAKLSTIGGSPTAPRLEASKVVSRAKGIASSDTVKQLLPAAGFLGTYGGFSPTGIALGILGSGIGKGVAKIGDAASSRFDARLIEALKDPRLAASLMDSASKTSFIDDVGKALARGGRGAAGGAASIGARKFMGGRTEQPSLNIPQQQEFSLGEDIIMPTTKEEAQQFQQQEDQPTKQDIKAIEAEIDADPFLSAVYETESDRKPDAKNPKSSATGGFQLVNATAKTLGVKDRTDLGESLKAMKTLTEQHREMFGDDPKMLYAAHFLGATTLRKWLAGENLTEKQAEHVREFKKLALPRFERIYKRITTKQKDNIKV